MISGIVSLCLNCLFSISVYARTNEDCKIYTTYTNYHMYAYYDKDYVPTTFTEVTTFDNLNAYIDQGTSFATDNVDSNYPPFVVADSSDHTNSNAIPMTRRCLPFSDLSEIWVNTNGATGNTYVNNIIDYLMDLNPLSSYSSSSAELKYEVLYKLGYRITGKCQTTTSTNNTVWLFTLQKLQGSDNINFYGYTDTNGQINSTSYYFNGYYNFLRIDFDTLNIRDNNNQILELDSNQYVFCSGFVSPASYFQFTNTTTFYQTNDCTLHYYREIFDSNNNSLGWGYRLYITGPNPYVIFLNIKTDENAAPTSYNGINSYWLNNCSLISKDVAGDDLSSINQHLVTIEDLLSDLQVTEINNIYQDITNEYNIDIDLTINNYLSELQRHIRTIDVTDPKYTLPSSDSNVGGLKRIYVEFYKTLDDTGLSLFYLIPGILLILGVIL